MDVDAQQRRSALVGMKLAVLAREHAGVEPGDVAGFGGGAGVLAGTEAWVYLDDRPERGLGAALAWALRHGATAVVVLADAGTGQLARRAEGFDFAVRVFHVD